MALERAIAKYKKKHPNATTEELLKHVISFHLPGEIPNTPGWHRKQLNNLLALVDARGLPTLFLTLTADELSDTRFEGMDSLEEELRRCACTTTHANKHATQHARIREASARDVCCRVCVDWNWKDAPAECAYLFHKRCELFLKKVLKVQCFSGAHHSCVVCCDGPTVLLEISEATNVCLCCAGSQPKVCWPVRPRATFCPALRGPGAREPSRPHPAVDPSR